MRQKRAFETFWVDDPDNEEEKGAQELKAAAHVDKIRILVHGE